MDSRGTCASTGSRGNISSAWSSVRAGVRRFRRRWPLSPLCSAEAFEVVGASPSGVEELRPRRAGGESGEQEDARRVKGHALRRHTRARARRYVHTRRRERRRRRRGCTSRAHGTRAALPKRLLLRVGRNCIGADEPAGTERLFARRQAQSALRRRPAHARASGRPAVPRSRRLFDDGLSRLDPVVGTPLGVVPMVANGSSPSRAPARLRPPRPLLRSFLVPARAPRLPRPSPAVHLPRRARARRPPRTHRPTPSPS